jgi:protein-S-isoprenylcysteine O-methyltransferase Ste14
MCRFANPVIYLAISRLFERLFVWLGGALFVASLAFCAYSYVVRWSGTREPLVYLSSQGHVYQIAPGLPAAVFDGLLLALFATHHSLFARTRVKRWLVQMVAPDLLRSVYVWIASLLLIVVCLLWQPIDRDLYHITGWRAFIHAAVQVLGVLVIAWSVRAIDALELAGIRHVPPSDALQTVGPYRLVRHPLYTGWMLAVFGAAHLTADRFAFAVFTTAYLAIAIPWEERALVEAFGAQYEQYKLRVRWRLIPYIY